MWGLCLVFLGIGLFGSFTGLFTLFFKGWWTLFIIEPAIIDLFKKRNKTFSFILLSIGVSLLLQQQDLIEGSMIWKVVLAFAIVILGIKTIFSRNKSEEDNIYIEVSSNGEHSDRYSAIFSGQECRYGNKPFCGAAMTAIFGGVDLDLRDAIINEDTEIKAVAIFGGCKIIVPEDVNIKVENDGFMGGVSDKVSYRNPDFCTLRIKSTTIFGGVEIKTARND